jgi:hypothetical protein
VGEWADYYLELELNRMLLGGVLDDDPAWDYPEVSPLDQKTWTTKDGRVLSPAKDMTESHILNTQRMLLNDTAIDFLRTIDLMRRNNGYKLYDLLPDVYIEKRIKTSKLWREFQKGLKRHQKLNKKVNDLNKGILEI